MCDSPPLDPQKGDQVVLYLARLLSNWVAANLNMTHYIYMFTIPLWSNGHWCWPVISRSQFDALVLLNFILKYSNNKYSNIFEYPPNRLHWIIPTLLTTSDLDMTDIEMNWNPFMIFLVARTILIGMNFIFDNAHEAPHPSAILERRCLTYGKT